MKVLFVTHLYPPSGLGGTEVYTHGLATGLLQEGHDVRVLCTEEWDDGPQYWNGIADRVYEGVPVRRVRLNWTRAPDVNRYLYDNPVVDEYLGRYLAELRPDIVHVTSCNTLSASVIAAARRAALPVVVTLTDFWFMCPQVTLLRSDGRPCDGNVVPAECLECLLRNAKAYRWLTRLMPAVTARRVLEVLSRAGAVTRWPGLRGMALNMVDRRVALRRALEQADRVLIGSSSARRLFVESGVARTIDVVPYGHDLRWLDGYGGKTSSAVTRFGFIGQISPMKGPHILIEAYEEACGGGEARLLVYGNLDRDPHFGGRLRTLAEGRPDVEFRGTYAHGESARVFSEIDVLVVPSLWHDYPLVISEAFAAQTPVIASDFGGMGEFVRDGVDGLLFERGSVAGLAGQLRRILSEPGLLARLRAGVPPVKTMRDAVVEMEAIYRSIAPVQRRK